LIGPSGRWKLQLPKPPEKTKFQTRAQIERRIGRGGLSDEAIVDLWKGLYLDEAQISSLLVHVKKRALHPFIYPMFAFTTYTGARRSEVARAEIDDVDLDTNQIMIRERKRRKHLSASTRFVPLHPQLRTVLREWLAIHPGGAHLFVRPNTIPKGRRQVTPEKLTPNQATHHFKHTLRDSEHSVVAGFHVLRHSFGSNLVRSGKVPSHIVAQWMGHTTDEMKQLYQHLFPQDGVAQISVLQC
jgi:integrase